MLVAEQEIQRGEREPRYLVRDGHTVSAVVIRSTAGACTEVAAELLDISTGGLKLTVSESVLFEEPVEVRIDIDEFDLHLSMQATVRWIRNGNEDDSWTVGCSLSDGLQVDALDELVKQKLLDRREHARQPMDGNATVQWEGEQAVAAAAVLDLSSGGFCIVTDKARKAGTRLILMLGGQQKKSGHIMATSRWSLKFKTGYLVGCQFKEESGFTAAREFLVREIEQTTSLGNRRRWFWPCLAVVAATLAAGLYALLG